MQWQRGFTRIWIVFSVVWICVSLFFALTDRSIPSLTKGCHVIADFEPPFSAERLPAEIASCESVWERERLELAKWTFIPPIALFIIGALLAWILRGFRRAQSP